MAEQRQEKRLKKNAANPCPLNDPSIGIISENDHKVGLCLCRYCSCGLHKCYKETLSLYPKNSFSSKYQHDYQRIEVETPQKQEYRRYRPNTAKMDLKTTNQIEYQHRRPTPEVTRSVSFSPNKQEIAKITAYACDYPNWGPMQVNHEKRWHPPVRSVDLAFQGKSSYKGQFHEFEPSKVEIFKSDITQFNAFGSKFSLAPKERLSEKTTYKEKMKDYSENELNARVVVKATPLTPTPATPAHFKTTFGEFYTNNTPASKDPRQLRFNLQSKNSKRNKSAQIN